MKKRNSSKSHHAVSIEKAREARQEARQEARKEADKKRMQQVLIGIGCAVLLVAVLSFAFIRFYGDNVVARVNGSPIYGSEIVGNFNAASTRLSGRGHPWSENWDSYVREESARMVALDRLYQDFGAGLGLEFEDHETPASITNRVTMTIIDDPALFADFERFLPEPVFDDATERAWEIYERAQAGEDFDMLMETYGEDPGMEVHVDGYTFIAEQMVPEFSAATMALEIGEISEPVRSGFGYHIILRVEPIPENILDGVEADVEDMLGAKHVLIMAGDTPTEHDRMRQAVLLGFQEKLEGADITFNRGALNRAS